MWGQRGDAWANADKCKVKPDVAHRRCVYTGYYFWCWSDGVPFFSELSELLTLCGQLCNHLGRWQLYFSSCVQQPALVWRAVHHLPHPSDQVANKSLVVPSALNCFIVQTAFGDNCSARGFYCPCVRCNAFIVLSRDGFCWINLACTSKLFVRLKCSSYRASETPITDANRIHVF